MLTWVGVVRVKGGRRTSRSDAQRPWRVPARSDPSEAGDGARDLAHGPGHRGSVRAPEPHRDAGARGAKRL